MKKLCLLIAFLLLLALTACAPKEAPETTVPTTTSVPTETTVETTQAPPETTEAALVAPEPAFDDYVYQYEDARDLSWEQDVVYFAKLLLGEQVVKGHPKLVNEEVQVISWNNRISMEVFYDADLRDTVIQEVHELIRRIPELNDTAVQYEMQRIIALLNDAHGYISMPVGEFFPFGVEQLEADGELGLYAVMLPTRYEHLLFAKLESINGVPAQEVMDRLIAYIPTENDYRAAYAAYSILHNGIIMDKTALQAVGVVGAEEDTALFRFITESGEAAEIRLEALDLNNGEYHSLPRTGQIWTNMDILSYSQYFDSNMFFQRLPENDALYIRLYQMQETADLRMDTFLQQIRDHLHQNGGVSKTIIDIRDNPGGYTDLIEDLVDELTELEIGKTYVLINSGSFSAAVLSPWYIKNTVEDAVLVGTPAGQPINFFANATNVPLKNHDIFVSISYRFCTTDPENTDDALMPDILVYPNLEDYKQGIDTVLEAALAD